MRLLCNKVAVLLISAICALTLGVLSPQPQAHAASSWDPGRIIDDAVFSNANTMTIQDIQNFLNSKVPVCDTWGTKPSENGGGTRAQYGASRGNPAPFICLKDYVENNKSAARIIYETGQDYKINPQVLIVLLQKEQGLITDEWPFAIQYRSATGYGCPDTAPCESEYYGFTNQVRWAARMFRSIMDNNPNWYTPYILGDNYIQYNPNASCGGTNVTIQNRATQALYNYTPYQPNPGALAAGYGTAPCGAYGNRNFWLYFNDWFGSTTDNRLFYRAIQGNGAPEVYLQTSVGKYYVPSYALLAEWGITPGEVQVVSQSYVAGLPTKTTLSNTLTDGTGNLYVVEGGSTHRVPNPTFTALWNADTTRIVESLGLSYKLIKKEPLGRFISLSGGDGSIWLVDGSKRHLVNTSMLYTWGYYPGITNVVSQDLFNRYTAADPVSLFASHDGGTTVWAIEASSKHPFRNNAVRNAFVGSSTPANIGLTALSLLADNTTLTRFVYDASAGSWYMVDAGKKYYISRGELATLWGKTESMQALTPSFLSHIPSAGNLTYTAQSSSDSSYWLIAKQRHYIPTSDINVALTGSATAPPAYSHELIQSLPQGETAQASIKGLYSPYNYSYALDSGVRRYATSPQAQSAWSSGALVVPNELLSIMPEGSFIGTVVKANDGKAYYVETGSKYQISSDSLASWGISPLTPTVTAASLTRFQNSSSIEDRFTNNGTSYIMSAGAKYKVGVHKDAYPQSFTSSTATSSTGDMNMGGELSYLARSSDASDQRVWLVNKGSKILLPQFEQRVNLGYLSRGVRIMELSPGTIDLIPSSSAVYSNLIQKTGSGIKFVNFGHALSFPDGPTLVAHVNSDTGILDISSSIYDQFQLNRNVSRIVYDDLGRYFYIENGHKRYITSWSAFAKNGYPQVGASYLHGTTMNLLPTGQQIQ